jgi:hypothetical protein
MDNFSDKNSKIENYDDALFEMNYYNDELRMN